MIGISYDDPLIRRFNLAAYMELLLLLARANMPGNGFSGVTQGSQQFNIPPWSPVIQVGQNVVSAILIFLFLLSIRNQFKIK
jgi:hypothetical protein